MIPNSLEQWSSLPAIGGLIGARLLFIIEEWEHFFRTLLSFLLSGSGFSWFGGLLVGGLTTAWSFKKYRLPFWEAADMSAPALALAYGMGRIGCFLAGDGTWGKVSDMPWAMAFPNAVAGWADPLTGVPYPPGVRVHPTQLYELVKSLIVFAILWSVRKRPHAPGMIFYLYLILAGSMRFIVEFWACEPSRGCWFDRVPLDESDVNLCRSWTAFYHKETGSNQIGTQTRVN
jgi:phosphatidylglycerol---prolipoprotein diacylglyceryl transferase